MENDSPLTTRLPTAGIWWHDPEWIYLQCFQFVNILFLKLDSFCPITMGPKHFLWFTEVILNRSELQIAHSAEDRVQHGELCCREEWSGFLCVPEISDDSNKHLALDFLLLFSP